MRPVCLHPACRRSNTRPSSVFRRSLPSKYTAEQKKAAEEFLAARKVPVFGPFEPMMYSPKVMSIARATGDYLRYHSAIGNTLSELVILVTAREWSQDYEWYVH